MRTFYLSRISIPLWLAIFGLVFLFAWPILHQEFTFQNFIDRPFRYLPWILIILLFVFLLLGTHYRFQNDSLIIKIGPFIYKRIQIRDIKSIERSYDLIASPANSLKRLRINFSDAYILISPSHEKEFIKFLTSINPDIDVYSLEKAIKF